MEWNQNFNNLFNSCESEETKNWFEESRLDQLSFSDESLNPEHLTMFGHPFTHLDRSLEDTHELVQPMPPEEILTDAFEGFYHESTKSEGGATSLNSMDNFKYLSPETPVNLLIADYLSKHYQEQIVQEKVIDLSVLKQHKGRPRTEKDYRYYKIKKTLEDYFRKELIGILSNSNAAKNLLNKKFIRKCLGIIQKVKARFSIKNKHNSKDSSEFLSAWCESYVRFLTFIQEGISEPDLEGFIAFISIRFSKVKVGELLDHPSLHTVTEASKQKTLLESNKKLYTFYTLDGLTKAANENKIVKAVFKYGISYLETNQDSILEEMFKDDVNAIKKCKDDKINPLIKSFRKHLEDSN